MKNSLGDKAMWTSLARQTLTHSWTGDLLYDNTRQEQLSVQLPTENESVRKIIINLTQ